jgi:hypothetical protein
MLAACWAACWAATISVCEFSCTNNRCGDNATVQSLLINHTFVSALTRQPGVSVLAVNLSGRGITSVAPGGLSCFSSQNDDGALPLLPLVMRELSLRNCSETCCTLHHFVTWLLELG